MMHVSSVRVILEVSRSECREEKVVRGRSFGLRIHSRYPFSSMFLFKAEAENAYPGMNNFRGKDV